MHMRIPAPLRVAVLSLVLAACGGGPELETPGPVEDPLAAAAATITAEDMVQRIGVLSHDSMRGRDTPSPGLEMAARYIVDEFRRMGLEGGAGGGEYVQRYPFPLIGLDTARVALTLGGVADAPTLAYGDDYLLIPGSAETVDAPLFFVGEAASFGASEPTAGSLAGRLPVVLLGNAFDQATQGVIGRATDAAEAAGAEAIVFVLGPTFPAATYSQIRAYVSRPRRSLGGVSGVTTIILTHAAAEAMFDAAGVDYVNATQTTALGGMTASLRAPVARHEDDTAPNVVAILRGSDPDLRDEYVVFSAHMDHVGVGRPDATGDSIYNGADDDASGTSALLEVAEAFTYLLERPARSLVFLAVSGEEKGLLGSRWFSEHPTVPLADVVADLNVDMIGRNSPDTIVVIGQEYSSLGPAVHAVAAAHPQLGLTVSEDIWPEERFFFRSDHFNFARKEIPALFFFAGVHEDYHQPSDEVEKIDGDKAARVARLIFYTAHAIADTPAAPQWTDEGLGEIRALTGGAR